MSHKKEVINYINNENSKFSIPKPLRYLYLDIKKIPEKSKSKLNEKEKELDTPHTKNFLNNQKNKFQNKNNKNNINNANIDSKSIIINNNNKYSENFNKINTEKVKNIALTNKNENHIIPIFDKKLIIKNKEQYNSKNIKNYALISNNEKNFTNNINNINNNKVHILNPNKSKKTLPQKYRLNLDNNFICYNNNSTILNYKGIQENKIKIIKLKEKFDYTNNLEPNRGRIIALSDISAIKNKKTLKKCISKPIFTHYKKNIYDIIYIENKNDINNSNSKEKFNFEKYQKSRHNTNSFKKNNFYSYQAQAPHRNISALNQKKTLKQMSSTPNLKNKSLNSENQKNISNSNNNNNKNYQKIFIRNKRSCQNLFIDSFDRNKSKERKSKSKPPKNFTDNKTRNQVNNNNININNVFINLDSITNDYFNNSDNNSNNYFEEQNLNKGSSTTNLNNKTNKSSNNIDISNDNLILINELKMLWKKLGGINEHYKMNFLEKMKYLKNDEKIYLCTKEKESLINLITILERLNSNISKRKSINIQLKKINSNNPIKIEEISKLLNNLRLNSINIINDYINFKQEISYDLIKKKIINKINNFPDSCLINIEKDMTYLYSHEYLSTLYKFNKYPDPFLLTPSKEVTSNKNFYLLPIDEHVKKEIQKANFFLIKEKMYRDIKKRNADKSSLYLNNNSIFIRNVNNNRKVFRNNIMICSKVCYFDIINKVKNKNNYNDMTICGIDKIFIGINGIKKFNKNLTLCSKTLNLDIINNNNDTLIKSKNIFPCFNVLNFDIKSNYDKKFFNKISICNNNFFEIKNNEKTLNNKNEKYSISKPLIDFEIITNKCIKSKKFEKLIPSSELNNLNFIPIKKTINSINKNPLLNNINTNNKEKPISKMPKIIPNKVVCPYNSKIYPPIELLYSAYIKTVSQDIKTSFKIMPDINYYLTIGVSPKIILFKENNSILYGMATVCYAPNEIYKKSLIISSISCANNYSIIDTLLRLIEYCDKYIEYDEIVLYLYFYKDENKIGEYLLNEEYKNMIKTKTLFKWTALENSENERKIKYHYKKSFNKNYIENKNSIKILKDYVHLKFYRFIKYNEEQCEYNLTAKEYTDLFNVIDIITKYSKNIKDYNDVLNSLFSKLQGLKKKRLLKLITEFNFSIFNSIKPFFEEMSKNEDKLFSQILLKRFLPLLKNIEKDKKLGFFCCDISTTFSSIIKLKINEYEYNIISIDEFNIESYRLNNEQNKEGYNNYIYLFKSQNKSISFLIYELDIEDENQMNIMEYKYNLFYKILKRILTKDNDEPVKVYKKIGIPSFKYYNTFDNGNINGNKIADFDILDGNDWFNFCIENNSDDNLFSFPVKNINKDNEDIKMIYRSFIIGIINPELTLDYQIPALNMFYINKNCWNKK